MSIRSSCHQDDVKRVWVRDTRWIVVDTPRKCRMLLAMGDAGYSWSRRACGKPAYYGCLRPNGYWFYCEEHLADYGKRVRDGIVEMEVVADSPAANG